LTDTEILAIYQRAVNKIDDYLEYWYSDDADKVRNRVLEIINVEITEKLRSGAGHKGHL
jgi:hypothetical protein